jgi:hypothetical protein
VFFEYVQAPRTWLSGGRQMFVLPEKGFRAPTCVNHATFLTIPEITNDPRIGTPVAQ